MNRKFTPKGEYELNHNPGDDFKEIVYCMNDEKPHIAPYFVPILALLGACFAIEAYINMVGQQVDPNWIKFDKGHIPLKDRLKRIYSKINKTLVCGQGIWQDVLKLFEMRIQLVHPVYINRKEIRIEKIPDIFDTVEKNYPPYKAKETLEKAIDALLNDTNLTHLRDVGKTEGYSGSVR